MIYFDNGATTFPKPQSVVNAVNYAITQIGANPGRGGHNMAMKASDVLYECRSNAAKLFDIDNPENVIITNNCTTALNTVIKGVLKSGDHAVISSYEHNAVVRPLEFLKSKGIEYSIAQVEYGDVEKTIDNFRSSFRENTKLVICTHASNAFGIRLPIERISALCKLNGILFCTDAAQTAGIIPISLKNTDIDYLCTAGHKGLYGPMGTGLLIINSDVIPESLTQGGTGSLSVQINQPEILPDKFESGTHNLLGIAGLNEGIKYVMHKTEQRIFNYEIRLAQNLYDGLAKIDDIELYTKRPNERESVPVVSFNLRNIDSETTAQILNDKFNIAVRAGLHCAPLAHKCFGTVEKGTVRAVISSFSTMNEVNYLIKSVSQIKYYKRV
ncbi:aminotransferase class V-fold PLP-dependent enzyme [Ruminococcus sp.]|uniref:aminotransferase class V-fold PLP-dependent enzyme n=1 Tax=Ruminococcus sp. TaxID=41978 RepID=UPI003862D98D